MAPPGARWRNIALVLLLSVLTACNSILGIGEPNVMGGGTDAGPDAKLLIIDARRVDAPLVLVDAPMAVPDAPRSDAPRSFDAAASPVDAPLPIDAAPPPVDAPEAIDAAAIDAVEIDAP